jgi:hypothetical protein
MQGGCCARIKSEFQWQKIGLKVSDDDRSWVNQFGDFGWSSSRLAYVVWRAILTSTMIVGFGLDLASDVIDGVAAWFPIYLSNWALLVETCYLSAAFFIALWIYTNQPDPASEQPFSTKVAWLLRSTGQSGALVVSVSYWALVHDGKLTLKTLWIHAINSLVVCIDIVTSCYEVRLMHYAYVLAFGGIYTIWTVIHYHVNIQDGRTPSHRYIYSAIDWSEGNEGKVRRNPAHPAGHPPWGRESRWEHSRLKRR